MTCCNGRMEDADLEWRSDLGYGGVGYLRSTPLGTLLSGLTTTPVGAAATGEHR